MRRTPGQLILLAEHSVLHNPLLVALTKEEKNQNSEQILYV